MNTSPRAGPRSSRKAATRRGDNVRQLVVDTAIRLLHSRSFHEVPLVELAREAGVVRASLLLQYQQGWPDVLLDVALQQLSPDQYYQRADAQLFNSTGDRVLDVLSAVLTDAEAKGRLYANMRAATFLWGADLLALYTFNAQDFVRLIANLLAGSSNLDEPNRDIQLIGIAEVLYEATLDLAARHSSDARDWAEHRSTLRSILDATTAGLKLMQSARVDS